MSEGFAGGSWGRQRLEATTQGQHAAHYFFLVVEVQQEYGSRHCSYAGGFCIANDMLLRMHVGFPLLEFVLGVSRCDLCCLLEKEKGKLIARWYHGVHRGHSPIALRQGDHMGRSSWVPSTASTSQQWWHACSEMGLNGGLRIPPNTPGYLVETEIGYSQKQIQL